MKKTILNNNNKKNKNKNKKKTTTLFIFTELSFKDKFGGPKGEGYTTLPKGLDARNTTGKPGNPNQYKGFIPPSPTPAPTIISNGKENNLL